MTVMISHSNFHEVEVGQSWAHVVRKT